MSIKLIELTDIESHVHTIIELDENLTAILGSSGAGKSVIFRALMSLFSFTKINARYDCPRCSIRVVCGDGTEIKRERLDTVKYKCSSCSHVSDFYFEECPECESNKHLILREKVHDKYFINGELNKKMGRGWKQLPKEIKKLFPLAVIEIGEKPFFPGLKSQFQYFLWDQLSPSQLSNLFSILEGNDYVESLLKVVKGELRDNNKRTEYLSNEVSLIKREIEETELVINNKREEVENYQARYKILAEKSKDYLLMDQMAKELKIARENCFDIKQSLDDINVVDVERLNTLVKLISEMTRYQSILSELETDIKKPVPEVKSIEEINYLLTEITSMGKAYKQLSKMATAVKSKRIELDQITEEIDSLDTGIRKRFLDNDICPFTGWPISKECKAKMMENTDE